MLRNAATAIDELAQEARAAGKKLRAIGAGWALSDINITDGILLNTKQLNSRFDVTSQYFEPSVASDLRGRIIIAQCGNQIAEINDAMELSPPSGRHLSLQAAGIGNGQTIAGAVSGNTHGSQVNFGAMNDFVVGIHLVTGSGEPLWIERASRPVFNSAFADAIGAQLVRNDAIFHASVVSFGTFGVVAALAIEMEDRFHLDFGPIIDRTWEEMKAYLDNFDPRTPQDLYHHEFIWDPYSKRTMEVSARKVPYVAGYPTPVPRWIMRTACGFAPGANAARILANAPISSTAKAKIGFDNYRNLALLNGVRGTPGQIYTSSLYYLEGYAEAAFAVSLNQASKMMDISRDLIVDMDLPTISQVRFVYPTKATLGFTQHGPRTTVFEFGLANDSKFPLFEKKLGAALRQANIPYTMHWSKNAGISSQMAREMYGSAKLNAWKSARRQVFQDNQELMKVFENSALVRAGLDG